MMVAELKSNEISSQKLAACATLADVDGKREVGQDKNAASKQLELIERQLHNLIGQVQVLKKLITT
jgi:hypothetical protein